MKRFGWVILIAAMCLPLFGQPENQPGDTPAAAQAPRFMAIDVFVDAGDNALAVYQVEVKASQGDVKVVGVEGGEGVFSAAPYYDPEAMQGERVIVGALSTLPEAQLPRGKVRVARVHVMVEGAADAVFEARVMAAGGPDGARIEASGAVERIN
jgi:hypothetical protein